MTNLFNSPKPFSPSAEENKVVIFETITPFLQSRASVLEVASGTGQHAVYFAKQLPHLIWQTSDLLESHNGIKQWLDAAHLPNTRAPLALDVSQSSWPKATYDALFSANSFHIMSQQNVVDFFAHTSKVLNDNAVVMIYGPFNYRGAFTSESNAKFDVWLKSRNPLSGIKNFENCNRLATQAGFTLIDDIAMPANNRIIIWQK